MSLFLLLACCSFVFGCAGLERLLAGQGAVSLCCHLLSAASGGGAAVHSDSRRLGRHLFHSMLAIGLPFFGGVTAFFLAEAVKRKRTGSLADEFAVYLNDAASFRESVPVSDAEIPATEHLTPLHDILLGNASEAEQRIAVENLVSMETPAALEILRRVAERNVGEGKFFAMTALGQMEEKLLGKLQRQEEFIASGRDESVTPILETAGTYIDFVYYRIAVEARREEYLARAAALLESALEKDGCSGDVRLRLGRVRLLAGDALAAMDCFNVFLESHPGDAAALLWRAEAWRMLGNYSQVRADCRAARRGGAVPAGIAACVSFWLHDNDDDGGDEDERGGEAVVAEGMVPA